MPLMLVFLVSGCGGDEHAAQTAETRSASSASSRAADLPWNVVLITLDTTRADALGAYAGNGGATPKLDAFAAEAVVFEQVAASSPSTLPSHATIFTGKQPYAHGARSNLGYTLAAENVTLAEVLSEAGYATRAEIAAVVLRPQTGIAQGFREVTHAGSEGVSLKRVYRKSDGMMVEYPIRTGSDIARRGIEFIRAHRDAPFFLWLHFFDAHDPYAPPQPYLHRFPNDPYRASVAYQDAEVGRVFDAIDALGLRERTLVVVTADHGESLGDHGVSKHSYYVYESTIRVPLLIRGPAPIAGGRRVAGLVRTSDLAPTILDLTGRAPLIGSEGVSLRPLLEAKQQDLGLTAYGESLELHKVFGAAPLRYLREGRWKYIHKVGPELYDLVADPGELHNRAGRETEQVARLAALLRERVVTGATSNGGASTEVDAVTSEQLLALGYAAGAGRIEDDVASLDLSGPDAANLVPKVDLLAEAQGHLLLRDFENAESRLTKLLADYPGSFEIQRLRSKALEGLERFDEAAAAIEGLVERSPDDLELLLAWARNLAKAQRRDEAVNVWERVLAIDPCSDVRQQVYLVAYQRRETRRQFDVLSEGMESCPESPSHMLDLAWALATSRDDSLRDGDRALALARRAVSLLERNPDPAQLDTLAAAFAESGDFESAIREQRKALALLRDREAPAAVEAVFRAHLGEFEAGRPVRDP